jgi:hypothetical protein
VKETGEERDRFRELLGRESWTLISLSKPIFTSSIGQWQRFLTEEEEIAIETELAEFYEIFGSKWRDPEKGPSLDADLPEII